MTMAITGGQVDVQAAQSGSGPDDFDYRLWVLNTTWPMELAQARLRRLKAWLAAQGLAEVKVSYRCEADAYRLVAWRGTAPCQTDEEVELMLADAAAACGAEPTGLIGLATQDGHVLGTFRLSVPKGGA